jgi:SAM-dependent MidA family methyltransferase
MTPPTGPNPPADRLRAETLRALLESSADRAGFVPYDRFMELALYGDGVGFYTREDSPFGREGDYYTAAHASPLFGRSIAERVTSVLRSLPAAVPLSVVEIGPGDGTLAESVVARIDADRTLAPRVDYVLVERSPTLAARSIERLTPVHDSRTVRVRVSGGVGADGPFSGVVLANEVLDAQPARRLVWTGDDWDELGVRVVGEHIVPATEKRARSVPAPELPRPLAPGAVLEVSPMAEGLVREVADHLEDGVFLALDYGMEETELLAAHPSGTLAAVRRHRPVDDPLADPGGSDLSVFVNFSRLRAVAARSGLSEVAFQRQSEALGTWGFPRLFEEAVRSAVSPEDEVRIRLAAKNLLFGFERFYALELAPPHDPVGSPGLT